MIKAETPIIIQARELAQGDELASGELLISLRETPEDNQETEETDRLVLGLEQNYGDEWIAGRSYRFGSRVVFEDVAYLCARPGSSTVFNPDHWSSVAVYGNPNFDRVVTPYRANEILTEGSPRVREIFSQTVRDENRHAFFIPTLVRYHPTEWVEAKTARYDGGYAYPIMMEQKSVSTKIDYQAFIGGKPVRMGTLRVLASPASIKCLDSWSLDVGEPEIEFSVVREAGKFVLLAKCSNDANLTLMVRWSSVSPESVATNQAPIWVTPSALGAIASVTTLVATDPEGYPVTYRPLSVMPQGISVEGDKLVVSGAANGIYNFTLGASDGVLETPRAFEVILGTSPVWDTFEFTRLEGTVLSGVKLNASNTTSYSIQSGSFPPGVTLNTTTGTLTGTLPSVLQNTSFQAVVRAHNGNLWVDKQVTFVVTDTPLKPAGEAFIVETGAEYSAATAPGYEPPTLEEVFDSWARFDRGDYFPSGTAPGGQATAWVYENGVISSTVNSSGYIGFVSTEALDFYTHRATLSSIGPDDDTIAVIVAFALVDNVPTSLVAVRSAAGNNPQWGLVQVAGATVTILVNGSHLAPTSQFANSNDPNGGGWAAGGKTVIEVQRNGASVTVRTSQMGSTVLDAATTLTYQIPSGSPWSGPTPYGYTALSQQNASFSDIFFSGGLDASVVYDARTASPKVMVYNFDTQTWVQDNSRTVYGDLDYPRLITNPTTGKTFKIDGPPSPYSITRVS